MYTLSKFCHFIESIYYTSIFLILLLVLNTWGLFNLASFVVNIMTNVSLMFLEGPGKEYHCGVDPG